MYKHSCGANLPTIAAAFVHLVTDCPLEERPAAVRVLAPTSLRDPDLFIGLRPRRQRVERVTLDTRIVRR